MPRIIVLGSWCMKKILGIIIFGLFWCSISNAHHELNQVKEPGSFGDLLVAGFLVLAAGFFIWLFWNKK